MMPFNGFPARMRYTSVPNLFFSALLPEMNDLAELKTVLHIFWVLYNKRGYPRFTSYSELAGSASLMAGIRTVESLREALALVVKRGAILHLAVEKEGSPEDIYLLNTESDRNALARIRSGELALPGLKNIPQACPPPEENERRDIFSLYEENIGMLTPMLAEELREAAKLYPEKWVQDAIREAVSRNKRSWRYISRILESWSAEGKGDGAYKRDSQKADAEKYARQQYGHLIQH